MKITLVLLAAVASASAQLTGKEKPGPKTTRQEKATKKVCNILESGGQASATVDNSAAIVKAWDACKAGGEVLVPSGSFGLDKWVALEGGMGVSLNLEGTIVRFGNNSAEGSMITVDGATDFEFYSGNSKGAIQGNGFEFHKDGKSGAGIVKLSNVTNFSVHDLALVDSPSHHLTIDTSTNGEVYNLVVHGAAIPGTDGVNVAGNNLWIHDVEVSNGDECVSVKTPAKNLLIESIFCNLSGGCAVGPNGKETFISFVTYQNIYTQRSNHSMSIISNGGSGAVSDLIFRNFTGHGNGYTINLDANSAELKSDGGEGVQYDYLTFANFAGTVTDGVAKPPIRLHCSPDVVCGSLEIDEFNVWTESGESVVYDCENAYGIGACMNQFAGNGEYTTTMAVTTVEAAKYAVTTMPGEITKGLGVTASIDIPALPTTFFPGRKPASPLVAQASQTAA